MADFDPEDLRQWTSAVFIVALAIVWFPICIVEMVVKHGTDYGVDSFLTFAVGVIIGGGVLLERRRRD